MMTEMLTKMILKAEVLSEIGMEVEMEIRIRADYDANRLCRPCRLCRSNNKSTVPTAPLQQQIDCAAPTTKRLCRLRRSNSNNHHNNNHTNNAPTAPPRSASGRIRPPPPRGCRGPDRALAVVAATEDALVVLLETLADGKSTSRQWKRRHPSEAVHSSFPLKVSPLSLSTCPFLDCLASSTHLRNSRRPSSPSSCLSCVSSLSAESSCQPRK